MFYSLPVKAIGRIVFITVRALRNGMHKEPSSRLLPMEGMKSANTEANPTDKAIIRRATA